MHDDPASTSVDFTSRELIEICRQMGPEEYARFDAQL
jgi:hypothetical protein